MLGAYLEKGAGAQVPRHGQLAWALNMIYFPTVNAKRVFLNELPGYCVPALNKEPAPKARPGRIAWALKVCS